MASTDIMTVYDHHYYEDCNNVARVGDQVRCWNNHAHHEGNGLVETVDPNIQNITVKWANDKEKKPSQHFILVSRPQTVYDHHYYEDEKNVAQVGDQVRCWNNEGHHKENGVVEKVDPKIQNITVKWASDKEENPSQHFILVSRPQAHKK